MGLERVVQRVQTGWVVSSLDKGSRGRGGWLCIRLPRILDDGWAEMLSEIDLGTQLGDGTVGFRRRWR